MIRSKSSAEGKKMLADWLLAVEVMDLPEFNDCTKAYRNWFNEILNSMDVPWSNGFIEGCNNKTKVLKRAASECVISAISEIESSSAVHENRAGDISPTRLAIISFYLYPNY